mmetsp:Transcript_27619/g.73023  ORF Transcript_27619/g.73023 Transcript_27619/m.73023 type:complete len:239 (+) Transcript_27619:403-1119(+)
MGRLPRLRAAAHLHLRPAAHVRAPLHLCCRHAVWPRQGYAAREHVAVDVGDHRVRHRQARRREEGVHPRDPLASRGDDRRGDRHAAVVNQATTDDATPPIADHALHLLQLPHGPHLPLAPHRLCRHPPRDAPHPACLCHCRLTGAAGARGRAEHASGGGYRRRARNRGGDRYGGTDCELGVAEDSGRPRGGEGARGAKRPRRETRPQAQGRLMAIAARHGLAGGRLAEAGDGAGGCGG